MKKLILSLTIITSGLFVMAQTVPRVPLYEVFTSSTCPPCKPASDHMTPIFEQYHNQLAIVRYQMNWPGAGDPYYTTEGSSRRTTYGVTGIPYLTHNGANETYSSVSNSNIDAELLAMAEMKMEVRYMIDVANQSIRIRGYFEALKDFPGSLHRIFIPILENKTVQNVKSNGEKEFHEVFKKMLPTANGDVVVGDINSGQTKDFDITYTFKGSFRLPSDASDEIDNATEHSVEEFADLHVIMFGQNMTTKEIYQAAVGESVDNVGDLERAWGSPTASVKNIAFENSVSVYPNPAFNSLTVNVIDANNTTFEFQTLDGVSVDIAPVSYGGKAIFNVSNLATGLYILKVSNGENTVVKKVSVSH